MLEAPVTTRGTKPEGTRRGVSEPVPRREGSLAGRTPSLPRRDATEDFASQRSTVAAAFGVDDEGERFRAPKRFSGLRFRLRGGAPRSTWTRVAAGCGGLLLFSLVAAVLWGTRSLILHDPRLVIESSSSIQITGNSHLTRPQLLSIFGEDVDRNLLAVSLNERRAQLESLPWVEHATVMRLLPNKIRVAIVERVPVAFVRQGGHIGLVDSAGVLLDMPVDEPLGKRYSFPVLTGIAAEEPASTRAARMKLFARFTSELDAGGARISNDLSEVDLSNPEDVKALIPSGGADILVHFGEEDFLTRYKKFQQNLPGWKSQYPKLASVDMRYERQVVLEMQPGAAVPVSEPKPAAPAPVLSTPAVQPKVATKPRLVAKHLAKPVPAPKAAAVAPHVPASVPAAGHLQTAFAVHSKGSEAQPNKAVQAGPR